MSPWEERYVRDLVDELDRLGRIPPDVASTARSAIDKGNYRDALEAALDTDAVDPSVADRDD